MKRFEIQFKPEEERPMQVIIADRIVQGKGGLWDFYDDNDDSAGSVEVARTTSIISTEILHPIEIQ